MNQYVGNRVKRYIVSSLLLFCLSIVSAQLLADNSSTDDSKPASQQSDITILLIAETAQKRWAKPVVSAVSDQLLDLDVSFQFLWASAFSTEESELAQQIHGLMDPLGATAAFVIQKRDTAAHLSIFLPDRERERVVRTVALQSLGNPYETLAVIVRAAATTLLNRQQTVMTEPRPEDGPDEPFWTRPMPLPREVLMQGISEPKPIEIDESVLEKERTLSLAVGYGMGMMTESATPWRGFVLNVGWQFAPSWMVTAGYVAFSKVTYQTEQLTLTLKKHPIIAAVRYRYGFKHTAIGATARFQWDIVTDRVVSDDPKWTIQAPGRTLQMSAGLFFYADVRLVSSLYLFINGGATVAITKGNYLVSSEADSRTVLRLLPVQPEVNLGLRMYFF